MQTPTMCTCRHARSVVHCAHVHVWVYSSINQSQRVCIHMCVSSLHTVTVLHLVCCSPNTHIHTQIRKNIEAIIIAVLFLLTVYYGFSWTALMSVQGCCPTGVLCCCAHARVHGELTLLLPFIFLCLVSCVTRPDPFNVCTHVWCVHPRLICAPTLYVCTSSVALVCRLVCSTCACGVTHDSSVWLLCPFLCALQG